MTRAALAKLLILVILAFIICLPEFFTLHRASKVSFLCLPYRPCQRGNQVKRGGDGKTGDVEIRRKVMCDPSQTPESEKWEQACTQENQSNTTDPVSDSKRGVEDPEKSWFMCETDMDMAELHSNISSSALKVDFEVSVELKLRDAETLNLTLYGRSNHSSLNLHPPDEEKEDDGGKRKAFYCCLPAPPTSESANQSRCLLWLANQTLLTVPAKEKLPWKRPQKDEWRSMFRVLWLALLCVVLLAIVTTVLRQIYRERHLCKKPKVHRVGYAGQRLKDGEKHMEINIPKSNSINSTKGMILHSYGSQPWSGLSPIQEVDTQDEIETLLDGNVDQCHTANLHHRGHPSTSSLTEEQAW
ncbi:uncharacterized protein LOC122873874 [Siniperca chuatsi]|uniref:uncharacterized protein LOC122873874 n=1 Tax=Siniperca chuatsi TaxID=119488 RepID=UPI001CE1CA1D|nr:uncharacterized protein LOC122873874 [Siniperca chuatsi]